MVRILALVKAGTVSFHIKTNWSLNDIKDDVWFFMVFGRITFKILSVFGTTQVYCKKRMICEQRIDGYVITIRGRSQRHKVFELQTFFC